MFSNLSSSSISLATVTPSLVMRGAPNDLSSTTLRPLGPSVTFTALFRISTPRSILSRASTENFTSLAAISVHSVWFCSGGLLLGRALFDDAHDVGLLHDEELVAVDLDFRARPFAEQHAVADLDVDGDQLAGLVAAARTHRDDLALGGLFLGGVGNDDAAGGLLLGIDALDDDAVVKRTKLHGVLLSFWRDLVLGRWKSAVADRSRARHKRRYFCPQEASAKYLALRNSECQGNLGSLVTRVPGPPARTRQPVSTVGTMLLTH